jgi:hypothetical protein
MIVDYNNSPLKKCKRRGAMTQSFYYQEITHNSGALQVTYYQNLTKDQRGIVIKKFNQLQANLKQRNEVRQRQ